MWKSTTHDWAASVDVAHLTSVRADPLRYAPNGIVHLILEVIAYPLDEAIEAGRGECTVTLHDDGSITVSDDGRGTDTGRGPDGTPIRKPVMATKDLRFLEALDAPTLPDGHPRRGMSVVAALSEWLTHTNHRHDGAWTQRYVRGVPEADLVPLERSARSGTSVRFLPDAAMLGATAVSAGELGTYTWPAPLTVRVNDERLARDPAQ